MDVWERCGLEARFAPETGDELVVSRPGGTDPSEISRVVSGMLRHRRLERTVPLAIECIDGKAAVRYRIAGLRKLTAAVRAGSVRAEHWERLLSGLCLALREGAQYCIRDAEYVLDPEWVWVKGEARDVALMALPLPGCCSRERAWDEWRALYELMAEHGLPERLLQPLHPENWERSTFSHRLWIEAFEEETSGKGRMAAKNPGADGAESPRGPFVPALSASGAARTADRPEAADGDALRFPKERANLQGWGRRLWAAGMKSLLSGARGNRAAAAGGREEGSHALSREFLGDEGAKAAPAEPLDLRTVLLSGGEAEIPTVRLSPPLASRPRLEIMHEDADRTECVELSGQRLRIGRGPDGVDIAVSHRAASRMHLELEWDGNSLAARDLGSTNGTYYMNQPMRPNERYDLRDGDLLRLPGAVVKVRLSPEG